MLLHTFEPDLQLVNINYTAFAINAAVQIYVSSRSGHSDFKTEKLYGQGITHCRFKKEICFLYINDTLKLK